MSSVFADAFVKLIKPFSINPNCGMPQMEMNPNKLEIQNITRNESYSKLKLYNLGILDSVMTYKQSYNNSEGVTIVR